jgi:hypothetical protein
MKKNLLVLVLSTLLGSVACCAQSPCPSGTLAGVLGTTCTIGDITFNFGTNFKGFSQSNDLNNVLTTTPIGPEAIGFLPVTTDNKSGFQLIPGFVANTNGTGLTFSSSVVTFSYGVKANAPAEVVSETVTIVGAVSQVFADNISATDNHLFTNQSAVQLSPTENFTPGGGLTNIPTVTGVLAVPGITADNLDPFGAGFTTQLDAFANGGDDATLNSATFLYTTAPQVPTPPVGSFSLHNVDLPGAQSTFATGINNRGQITGFFQDSLGAIHGYVADGADFHIVDFPDASITFPGGLSNSGKIAGAYTDAAGKGHGFTLEDGVFTSIDFPGAVFTSIIDINERGDLAGLYLLPRSAGGGVHGFIQDENGFTTLDFPNQAFVIPFTEAFGINNREEVNGLFLDANGNPHGFSWLRGVFQQIDVPGAGTTSPQGLNEAGGMVGIYTDLDGIQHGYVQRGSNFATLDFPGAVGTTILFQINDAGTIIGNYVDDQGNTHSFTADQQHGSGEAGQAKDAPRAPRKTPSQTCSPADWTRHPEKMRNPGTCHSADSVSP